MNELLVLGAGLLVSLGTFSLGVRLVDHFGGKHGFWAKVCVFIVCLYFGVMVMGFVSLSFKNQVVVVPESGANVEEVDTKAAQFALEQRTLDQTYCFTWAMLDLKFRMEDIQIMLNTIYALDANEHLSSVDVNKIFRKAEQTQTQWKLNQQKPKAERETCTPTDLLKKNKQLQKGLGLTHQKRTRQWFKSARRATYWLFTVEGLHYLGVDVAKWWPDRWTFSGVTPSDISSHPLRDYLDEPYVPDE